MESTQSETPKPPLTSDGTVDIHDYLRWLCADVGSWSRRNFGDQPTHRPMMGIIEELTELYTAVDDVDPEQAADAVGDTVIYMADYCHRRGWDLGDLWQARWVHEAGATVGLLMCIGKLCHHHLKGEQGIRGKSEAHDEQLQNTLSCVLGYLDRYGGFMSNHLSGIVQETWSQVKQRDWKKNPENAHAVAKLGILDNPEGGRATKDVLQQVIDENSAVKDKVQVSVSYEVGDDDDGGV